MKNPWKYELEEDSVPEKYIRVVPPGRSFPGRFPKWIPESPRKLRMYRMCFGKLVKELSECGQWHVGYPNYVNPLRTTRQIDGAPSASEVAQESAQISSDEGNPITNVESYDLTVAGDGTSTVTLTGNGSGTFTTTGAVTIVASPGYTVVQDAVGAVTAVSAKTPASVGSAATMILSNLPETGFDFFGVPASAERRFVGSAINGTTLVESESSNVIRTMYAFVSQPAIPGVLVWPSGTWRARFVATASFGAGDSISIDVQFGRLAPLAPPTTGGTLTTGVLALANGVPTVFDMSVVGVPSAPGGTPSILDRVFVGIRAFVTVVTGPVTLTITVNDAGSFVTTPLP